MLKHAYLNGLAKPIPSPNHEARLRHFDDLIISFEKHWSLALMHKNADPSVLDFINTKITGAELISNPSAEDTYQQLASYFFNFYMSLNHSFKLRIHPYDMQVHTHINILGNIFSHLDEAKLLTATNIIDLFQLLDKYPENLFIAPAKLLEFLQTHEALYHGKNIELVLRYINKYQDAGINSAINRVLSILNLLFEIKFPVDQIDLFSILYTNKTVTTFINTFINSAAIDKRNRDYFEKNPIAYTPLSDILSQITQLFPLSLKDLTQLANSPQHLFRFGETFTLLGSFLNVTNFRILITSPHILQLCGAIKFLYHSGNLHKNNAEAVVTYIFSNPENAFRSVVELDFCLTGKKYLLKTSEEALQQIKQNIRSPEKNINVIKMDKEKTQSIIKLLKFDVFVLIPLKIRWLFKYYETGTLSAGKIDELNDCQTLNDLRIVASKTPPVFKKTATLLKTLEPSFPDIMGKLAEILIKIDATLDYELAIKLFISSYTLYPDLNIYQDDKKINVKHTLQLYEFIEKLYKTTKLPFAAYLYAQVISNGLDAQIPETSTEQTAIKYYTQVVASKTQPWADWSKEHIATLLIVQQRLSSSTIRAYHLFNVKIVDVGLAYNLNSLLNDFRDIGFYSDKIKDFINNHKEYIMEIFSELQKLNSSGISDINIKAWLLCSVAKAPIQSYQQLFANALSLDESCILLEQTTKKVDFSFCNYIIGVIHETMNEPLYAIEYYQKGAYSKQDNVWSERCKEELAITVPLLPIRISLVLN